MSGSEETVDTSDRDTLVLTLPDDSSEPKDVALWAGVLVLLALVAYWPVTDGKLVWNDPINIAPHNMGVIFAGRWKDPHNYPLSQYHPVTFSVYSLVYQLIGQDGHGGVVPFPFHALNLLLHASNGVLLWMILRKVKLSGAWVGAALFLLLPINAQAVAWISQLASMLAGCFFFGAILAYLNFADEQRVMEPDKRWGLYALSLGLFILGMLSKSTAWAMPVVTFLLLWWKGKASAKHAALLAPMLLIAVILGLAAMNYEKIIFSTAGADSFQPVSQRLSLAGQTVWFYLAKMIAPVGLTVLYRKGVVDPTSWIGFVGLALLFVSIAAMAVIRRWRGALVGGLCLLACLLPWSGLFYLLPMRFSFVYDHYAYLASAVFASVLVGIAAALFKQIGGGNVPVGLKVGLSAVVLLAAGGTTWTHAQVFRDSVALWKDAVAKNAQSAYAHNRLALGLAESAEGDLVLGDKDSYDAKMAQALDQAKAASELDPRDAEAQMTWGRILSHQSKWDQALPHLQSASELDPKLMDAKVVLGETLVQLKRYDEAITALDAALAISSQVALTHRLLGEAFDGKGDFPRAISEQREALRLDRTSTKARTDLANVLYKSGNDAEALLQFAVLAKEQEELYRMDPQKYPEDPALWNAIGEVTAQTGNIGDAVVYFRAALRIDPTFKKSADNLKLAQESLERQRRAAATRASTQATTAATTQR